VPLAARGLELFAEHERTGTLWPLAESLRICDLALAAAVRDGEQALATYHGNLAHVQHTLAELLHSEKYAAQAVGSYRAAAAAAGDTDRAAYLCSLSSALRDLDAHTGDVSLLTEAADAARQAIGLADGEPDPATRFGVLAVALRALYDRTGSTTPLAECVRARRAALAASSGDGYLGCLSDLANDLRAQYERTGHPAALTESVSAARMSVAGTAPGNDDLPRRASNLCVVLSCRYKSTGDASALADGIRAARTAVAAAGPEHPRRATYLSDLVEVLELESQRTGDAGMLAETVLVARDAVTAAPQGHPLHAVCLTGLCSALCERYDRTGDTAHLTEASQVIRAALAAPLPDGPDRPGYLYNIGQGLRWVFERTGDSHALDEAVRVHREAVAATAVGDPARAGLLHGLCGVLLESARRTGDRDALTEAVDAARAVVAATAADDPARASRQDRLASALAGLYDQTGNSVALKEAVAVSLDALAATPETDIDRVARLVSVSGHMQTLAERTDDGLASIDATEMMEDALGALGADDPARAIVLLNLSRIELAHYRRFQSAGHLESAITYARDAVAATPAGHPELAPRLAILSRALLSKWHESGEALLPEALAAIRQAIAVTPRDASVLADRLDTLGWVLQARYEDTGDTAFAIQARRCFLDAARHPNGPAALRIGAYRRAAELAGVAGGGPREALACIEAAVELLPGIASRDLDRADAEHQIGKFTHLAEHAAEAAVTAGRPDRAVELLERTRGVLVAAEHDQRATRDHARPLTIGELAAYATDGPIVYVYNGVTRCDALILRGGPAAAAAVRLVPLGLDPEFVWKQGYRLCVLVGTQPADDGTDPSGPAAGEELLGILRWLDDAVVAPVLAALGHTGTPADGADWPRVWWCPVGEVAYFPLHAVCLDRVVSSYTPTARGLRYARAQPLPDGDRGGPTAPLVIAAPRARGVPPLPGARREAAAITALFPDTRVLPLPTRDRVLDALPGYPVVHFACHVTDGAEPGQSILVLYDSEKAPLSVADIGALRLAGGLAFLSACQTGVTTISLTNESVHIAGAFHLAGYQHVVGTLWPVNDVVAVRLASGFYGTLASTVPASAGADLGRAAAALHDATRRLRDRYPKMPALWATYTHTGP
jgi:hypothetical protein